ncbi:MAG TPA: tRNA (adenosine(37)-N6)-threonylcarbamoyltransferase complex dimerization subunit type 1 TsaB [Solirubrobacteraceae bacterium]
MIVLGFDTSTPATAIALRLPDGASLQARDDPTAGERPGHATRLLPLAADLLAQAGLRFADVQRIAVGIGPGTFTGLRIGLASARGLAQSLDVQLVGVSSLQALALAAANDREHAGAAVGLLALIDARRGEAFAAAYAVPQERFGDRRASPSTERPLIERILPAELAPPRALAPERFGEILDEVAADGLEIANWLALGNGAMLYRDALQTLGITVPADDSPLHRVSGEAICALGASGVAQNLDTVLPDYRRRPDAELALERSAGAGAHA